MIWIRYGSIALLATQLACNPTSGSDDAFDVGGADAGPLDAQPGDGATADATPDARPDAGAVLATDPEMIVAPPLFGDDGAPAEVAAAALIRAWQMRPSNEAEAQAQTAAASAARVAIREAGVAGADAIAARCEALPDDAALDHQACARLLTLVESPASLAYLDRMARVVDPPWPPGAHPTQSPRTAIGRHVAGWALGRRAAAGSFEAVDLLLDQARAPELPVRRSAVHRLLRARPRHRIKPRLRAVLPPDQHYLLYEVR